MNQVNPISAIQTSIPQRSIGKNVESIVVIVIWLPQLVFVSRSLLILLALWPKKGLFTVVVVGKGGKEE